MIIFSKDGPTSREERELEQLQQRLNIDGEQTSLKPLVTNSHDNLNRISSEERRTGQTCIQKGRIR